MNNLIIKLINHPEKLQKLLFISSSSLAKSTKSHRNNWKPKEQIFLWSKTFDSEECFRLVVCKTCHRWISSNVKASILKLHLLSDYQQSWAAESICLLTRGQSTCTKQWNDTRHWGRQDCSADMLHFIVKDQVLRGSLRDFNTYHVKTLLCLSHFISIRDKDSQSLSLPKSYSL